MFFFRSFIMFLCGKQQHKTCILSTDELRMAVKEVICIDPKEREKYKEALVAITVEESIKRRVITIIHYSVFPHLLSAKRLFDPCDIDILLQVLSADWKT